MGNLSYNTSSHAPSSKTKMEKDGKGLLEMKIHQRSENHFGGRDGGEVVILFVSR